MIGRNKSISISDSYKSPMWRTMNKPHLGFQYNRTGAFSSDQCTRNVEALFGQQFIQVETGNTPGNARKTSSYVVAVSIAKIAQLTVNLATPAATFNNKVKLTFRGR